MCAYRRNSYGYINVCSDTRAEGDGGGRLAAERWVAAAHLHALPEHSTATSSRSASQEAAAARRVARSVRAHGGARDCEHLERRYRIPEHSDQLIK